MIKQKKYVLIAEDNASLSRIMQKVLHRQGVTTHVVHNGADAIKSMDAKQPDLLLLDLLMLMVDGYGVLKYVQEKEYGFPVVMLSNVSDKIDREKCKKLGCADYLLKLDTDDDTLWAVVKKYLQ